VTGQPRSPKGGATPTRPRFARSLASWLAAWPVFASAGFAAVPDAAILQPVELRDDGPWWSPQWSEQLIRLLPGQALEDAARTLVDRRVQLRFDRDRALLQVRIPLG
jgi:hypothetical protein